MHMHSSKHTIRWTIRRRVARKPPVVVVVVHVVVVSTEYEPHGVKMLYDGKPVELTPEQEEVASMFAIMKETDYMSKPTFLKNFWDGFKEVRHTPAAAASSSGSSSSSGSVAVVRGAATQR
jgi:DNA topoisomerase IB